MAFCVSQFYFSPLKCMVPNTVNKVLVTDDWEQF